MIIVFSVENFNSFNSRQIISFAASKIAKHKDHVATVGNRKILKSALIYGANASGKSNLIEAANFSRKIILSGTDRVSNPGLITPPVRTMETAVPI